MAISTTFRLFQPAARLLSSAVLRLSVVLLLGLLWIAADAAPEAAAQSLFPAGTAGEPEAEQPEPVAELPDPLTPEAVRALVARLSDAEARALLLERLDAVATEEAADDASDATPSTAAFVGEAVDAFTSSIGVAVARAPRLLERQAESFANFWERLGPTGIAELAGGLIIASGFGVLAMRLFHLATRAWHAKAPKPADRESWRGALRFLFNRFCQDIAGVFVFAIVSRTLGRALVPEAYWPFATAIMWNMVALPMLGIAISRFVLAPTRPDLRLVNVDDAAARFLHRHQIGVFLLMGFAIAIVAFNDLNGVAIGEARLGFWLTLSVHLYLVWIIWNAWNPLVGMMRGFDTDITPLEERVARAYPYAAIAVVVGMLVVVETIVGFGAFELLAGAPHYATMFLLLYAPSIDTLIRAMVRRLQPPMTGEGPLAEKAYRESRQAYVRIGRVVAFFVVMLLIARFWRIDLANLATEGLGAQLAGRAIEVMLVVALGYLAWEIASLWINRRIAAERTALGVDMTAEEPAGGEGGGAGGSRLSTVLPLVKGALQTGIVALFGLVALGSLGIDITPLLAGAGIVGLAIGFGAQKLVSDVVSGLFFLIDDAFRTGEYIDVDGTVGTVEKISLRSMQLRHHRGAVHTIPYGEIPRITNYSRDWVIMKLKFTVPFDTDPNKVKKIFKQIGKDMYGSPEFSNDLLQPFKSQGVFDFDEVGMIVRGKFMARPGTQFTLRKEVLNRVKAAFEENGIDFARREVRVAMPDGAGQDQAAQAAVAQAVTAELQTGAAAPAATADDR